MRPIASLDGSADPPIIQVNRGKRFHVGAPRRFRQYSCAPWLALKSALY